MSKVLKRINFRLVVDKPEWTRTESEEQIDRFANSLRGYVQATLGDEATVTRVHSTQDVCSFCGRRGT